MAELVLPVFRSQENAIMDAGPFQTTQWIQMLAKIAKTVIRGDRIDHSTSAAQAVLENFIRPRSRIQDG